MIVFFFSINWINEYYWCINIKHRKHRNVYFVLIFPFLLNFYIFFNIYKFIIKFLSYYIATFFQDFMYLSKLFSSFIIKYIHLVSSKYISYILIFGKNMQILFCQLFCFKFKQSTVTIISKKISNSTISILKFFHLYNIVMNVQMFWNIYHYILSN